MSLVIAGDTHYTVSEVAKAAGKSVQTIKRWAAAGKIPPSKRIKTNKWRVYSQADLDRIVVYANQLEVEPVITTGKRR